MAARSAAGLGDDALQAQRADLGEGGLARQLEEAGALFARRCPRPMSIMYGAVIAVFGHRHVLAERLGVARKERLVKGTHAAAGVVDIVLALDVIAGGLQHRGDGIAQHGVARRADVQRAGGIGADVFDLHRCAVRRGRSLPTVRIGCKSASTWASSQASSRRKLRKPGAATSVAPTKA